MSDTDTTAIKLHATTDALVWTEEFFRIFPNGCDDHGTMLGWFANAIETGRNAAPAVPSLTVERLAHGIHVSNDHRNALGCLDMDREAAVLLLAALAPDDMTYPSALGADL